MYKENEEINEILNEADKIYGAKKCKDILKNYSTFVELKKNKKIKEGNYNVFINNKSEFDSYKEVIEILAKILQVKGVINTPIRYLKRSELRKEKEQFTKIKKLEEELLIIDCKEMNMGTYCFAEDVKEIIDNFPKKIFIAVGDDMRDGMFNEDIGNSVTWNMEIERLNNDDKKDYIIRCLDENGIRIEKKCSFAKKLAEEPFWKIKNEILNIILECTAQDITKINDEVIKNKLKRDYVDIKNKTKKNRKKLKGIEELNSMIGVKEIKDQVIAIMNYIKVNKDRGDMPALHMCFYGKPGTGKTTVARIIGKIFAEKEILSSEEKFVEVHARDLVGRFVGWTAQQTKDVIRRAEGGVLFIDEAYSLNSYWKGGYEDEAIATLIKEMEDKRDNICIILAGYEKEMKELIERNPGFESRIQFHIDFPDYTEEELYEIFKAMANEENYKLSSNLKSVMKKYFELEKQKPNFANGRCARNLFEKVKFEQANRVASNKNEEPNTIKKCDIEKAILKYEVPKLEKLTSSKRKIGF